MYRRSSIALLGLAVSLLGAALLFSPAQATISCTHPVTPVKWKAKVKQNVNLRSQTCNDSDVIGTLNTSMFVVDIVGEADGWLQVRMVDGRTGFVWQDFLTVTEKLSTGDAPVKQAESKPESTKTKPSESVQVDSALTDRLKGHILLQVESHGEAWYIHPEDGKRYYMKDGDTAYQMMREFGLGASNADIDALLSGNKTLAARVKGKILLAVQRHGEAYYINPSDLSVHYLKDGKEAYRIMRELSLGISNTDLARIAKRDFQSYLDKEGTPGTTDNSSQQEGLLEAIGSIGLNGQIIDNAVHLSWTVNRTDTSRGLRIVYGTRSNPSFPQDYTVSVEDPKARTKAFRIQSEGEEIRFRICQYIGQGQCGVYSNEIKLFVPANEQIGVKVQGTITLKGEVQDNDRLKLNWVSSEGMDSAFGFMVLASAFPSPTYPADKLIYLSNPYSNELIKIGMPAGTYYVRVCQYTGDACGVVSNEIVLTVQGISSAIVESPYQQGEVPAGVDTVALNKYWLEKINALRGDWQLRQLKLDQRFVNTATEWAVYMGQNDLATHDRPDGKNMHQWIDTKGLTFAPRYEEGGWTDNYFTENIAWGIASEGSTEAVKKVLDETLSFYLSEASYNGAHYRTIFHKDWNAVGLGLHFTPTENGRYKVYVAIHYGSLDLGV